MKRTFLITTCLVAAIIAITLYRPLPASSHLNDFTSSSAGPQPDHWAASALPVQWNLNPAHGANIQGSRSVADVIQASFSTWMGAPNTAVSAARGPDSGATAAGFNTTNLICFVCNGDFSSEAETLAVTITTTATSVGDSDGRGGRTQFVGQILDADLLFNPTKNFTTDIGGANQDLQTVATHEIGHFFGLDHSAVVRAIMFPFTPDTANTTLSYDDVGAISATYPKGSPDVATGVISGAVRLSGSAVFGAHVFADSQTAAQSFSGFNVRKSPIGAMSLTDGTYSITGVPPDSYVVTAEPMDLPVSNSDVSDFPKAFNKTAVQTNFNTRSH
jgi:hypothetical protein